MINNKRILAFIPARGGSKGIKEKNIIQLNGKPLIRYTIEAAKRSRYIDRIFVSTDSEKIAEVVQDCGIDVPYRRSGHLASDTAKTIDAVLDGVRWLEERGDFFDVLILLQPTSPLRTAEDIDGAAEAFVNAGSEGLASVSAVSDHPILMRTIGKNGKLVRVLQLNSTVRRQEMEPYYGVNGSIYINRIEDLSPETSFNDNEVPFVIPRERAIDIDDNNDLMVAEAFLRARDHGGNSNG